MHRLKQDNIYPINKRLDLLDTCSINSGAGDSANMTFFKPSQQTPHKSTYSWSSPTKHLRNEFERMRRLVRHVAPEQFKGVARPSHGPCNIVPTTRVEYLEHNAEMLKMATEQKEKNIVARKEAVRVSNIKSEGEVQPPIKSKFGKSGKVYTDGMSPVLCRETIWSAEYFQPNATQPLWPTQAELQVCGDRRENERAPTRCGRYLPPPKVMIPLPRPNSTGVGLDDIWYGCLIKKPLPLDEHGPIFSQGPPPIELINANTIFDNDALFEEEGRLLVGRTLMQEVGDKRAPFVPRWLAEQRQKERHNSHRFKFIDSQPSRNMPIVPS